MFETTSTKLLHQTSNQQGDTATSPVPSNKTEINTLWAIPEKNKPCCFQLFLLQKLLTEYHQ